MHLQKISVSQTQYNRKLLSSNSELWSGKWSSIVITAEINSCQNEAHIWQIKLIVITHARTHARARTHMHAHTHTPESTSWKQGLAKYFGLWNQLVTYLRMLGK
jgi:hypothetical protein